MSTILADKTILVTGGTGSIGCEIVLQALQQQAKKVIVFSRDEIKHFLMEKRLSDDRVISVIGDTRDWGSLERVFIEFNIDVVYHAAAMKHVVICENFPLEATETNILGTQNVVDLALKNCIPKMITISTDKAVYPSNVMGATKLIAERITLNANQKSGGGQVFSCVRFGNVANSRGSVIPTYVDNLLNRRPLQVTNRDVTRFIMEIPDAVKLVIKSTEYAQGGEIFILKMKAFRLGDLVEVMIDRIAPRLGIEESAIKVDTTGLVLGEKLHENLVSFGESSRLYELDDMFVVMQEGGSGQRFPGARRVELSSYSSKDVELLTKKELEMIALKYLERIRTTSVNL